MRQRAQSLLRDQGCATALPAGCRRQPRLLLGPGSRRAAGRSPASRDSGVRKLSRGYPCSAACAGAWPVLLAAAALALSATMAPAQTAYRYRDANGQWVFTDQAPEAA